MPLQFSKSGDPDLEALPHALPIACDEGAQTAATTKNGRAPELSYSRSCVTRSAGMRNKSRAGLTNL